MSSLRRSNIKRELANKIDIDTFMKEENAMGDFAERSGCRSPRLRGKIRIEPNRVTIGAATYKALKRHKEKSSDQDPETRNCG
jgi:hypothetical protein